MKKIALIRRSFRLDGGAEKSLKAYASVFKSLGYQVTLVCQSWEEEKACADQLFDNTVLLPVESGSRLCSLVEFSEQAIRWIRANPSYIVQSHEWIPGAHVLRLGDGLHSVWINRKRASRGFFSNIVSSYSRFDTYKCRLEKESLGHPNLKVVISNSGMVRDELLSRYSMNSNVRVEVVRNLISSSVELTEPRFSRCSRDIVVGFAGSGWERKNLELVLQSMTLLDGNYKLWIAGTDKNVGRYRRLAMRLGIISRVNFLGVVNEMRLFYKSVDCVVLPSTYDPFPNVCFEAMAFGKPIVITEGVGASDFRDIGGVFVAEDSPKSIAECISQVDKIPAATRKDLISVVQQYDYDYLVNKVSAYMNKL